MFALITTSLELQATPPFSQSTTLNISRALTFDLVIAMGGTPPAVKKVYIEQEEAIISFSNIEYCRFLLLLPFAAKEVH
jgi:hypothetical protein